MKTVYILHRDIDYEMGYVVSVFSTKDKAVKFLDKIRKHKKGKEILSWDEEEWTINEYTIDEEVKWFLED